MSPHEITQYLIQHYPGITPVDSWGETSFFYNPEAKLPRGVYFATLKEKDGDNDKASALDRTDVFRFNFSLSQKSYISNFGDKPSRPAAGGIIATGYDFTQLNCLMPHPIYGWMSWVCILNPNSERFYALKPLLDESYALVLKKYAKRLK